MKILFYKGVFAHDVVNYFVDELADYFEKKGHEIFCYDLSKNANSKEEINVLVNFFINTKIDIVLTFNCVNAVHLVLFQKLNTVYGSILVDHPYYHFKRLKNLNINTKNCFVGVYDQGTINTIKNYIDDKINIKHIMHGGSYSHLDINDKIYDVTVSGVLKKVTSFDEYINDKLDFIEKSIAKDIYIKAKKNYNKFLEEYLLEVLENNKLRELIKSDLEYQILLANVYYCVDTYMRKELRYKSILELLKNGIKVNYFGNDNNPELDSYPNFINHGEVPYEEMLNIIKQSKIVINTLPYFKNGSHERIFSAMLNKSLVVSNENNYGNSMYKDKENIVMFDINKENDIANKVKYYLENEEERNQIIENAYEITSKYNTWENRAEEILKVYEEIKQNL